ncbi:DUF6519 domain-containing protein [Leptolyngbya sp. AN03gr2]|uniref:DUF6519 domain-containing protein n=1 Tax=unclassified Leptolyngbya TaxID=2650499 RepID=UPI003D323B91
MKGDFTRSTFRREKHYSSVRMQQGRLQLDADWNEQIDIQRHLLQMQARDMLGVAGVPLADRSTELSFQLNAIDKGKDLTITPGRIYVDGILCELEPGSTLTFTQKVTPGLDRTEIEVKTLLLDGRNLEANQWIELFDPEFDQVEPIYRVKILTVDPTSRSTGFTITLDPQTLEPFTAPPKPFPATGILRRILTLNTQPDYPKSNQTLTLGKRYLAYLDVWQRHITAIEDPTIRESALSLPDTTTRTKTVWQVKLLELAPNTDLDQQWQTFLKPRTALLTAQATNTSSSLKRLENQLYRIEIHSPGKAGQATFKWSRDNGAIVAAIEMMDDTIANTMTIAQSHRDASQLFAPNQWVEITDEVRDLNRIPGTLVRLTAATSGTKLVFQKAKDRDRVNLTQFPKAQKPKVRRWDHTTSTAEILTAKDKWIPLGEEGIEIRFDENSDYNTGDYWLIPARTITNDIEWLRDDFRQPLPQQIDGINHAYARLALLSYADEKLEVKDDRNSLPSLANCLPKTGGEITGSLAIADSLTVDQSLTTKSLNSETVTLKSGKLNSSTDLLLQTNDQSQVAILKATGNVGIGVTNPQFKLQVASKQPQILQLSCGDRFINTSIQDDNLIHFVTNTNGYQFDEDIRLSTGSINAIAGQNLLFQTASLNRMTVLGANGNVGIGIDRPEAKLHIATTTGQTLRLSNNDRFFAFSTLEQAKFQTNCQSYHFDKSINVESGIINSTQDLKLQTAGNNQITVLQNNGNVGIGTETPTTRLHIASDSPAILRLSHSDRFFEVQTDDQTEFQTNTSGYHFDQSITIASGILNSPKMLSFQTNKTAQITVLQSGNVGIGTTTPEAKLHITGDIKVDGKVLHNDAQVSSSSANKDNIVDLTSEEATSLLRGLNPVKFVRREDEKQQPRAGFIAEEVPDLVASEDRQAVRLMELVAILTKNLKDHETTIASQAQQLANQAEQMAVMSDRIFALETRNRGERAPQRSLVSGVMQFFNPRKGRR